MSGAAGSRRRPLAGRAPATAVALTGLAIATYLTIVHYAGAAPACGLAHGCATVQQSEYAQLAGMPVALIGAGGYAAILATLARDGDWARTAAAFLPLAGLGFSGWLTYVEVVRLEAICAWCVGSAACRRAGRARGGARAQPAAAARPPSVSEKTAGADDPHIPSGPQSAPADECTQPRASASSSAQLSASRAGSRRRARSASSVAGPPRSARSTSSGVMLISVTRVVSRRSTRVMRRRCPLPRVALRRHRGLRGGRRAGRRRRPPPPPPRS